MNIKLEKLSGRPKDDFTKKWLEAVEKKGNNLVAGFDPELLPTFDQPLSETADAKVVERNGREYINNVCREVPAIKFNLKFFNTGKRMESLKRLCEFAKSKNLLVILDGKDADLSKTSKSGANGYTHFKCDYVTLSSGYAGNTEDACKFVLENNIYPIVVGAMSSQEFKDYTARYIDTETGRYLYQDVIRDAVEAGAGVVIGGTYKTSDQILERSLNEIKIYENMNPGKKVLILAPGFGAQGGNISEFLKKIKDAKLDPKQVMCNVGTSIMYPEFGKTRKQVLEEFVEQTKESL